MFEVILIQSFNFPQPHMILGEEFYELLLCLDVLENKSSGKFYYHKENMKREFFPHLERPQKTQKLFSARL